MTHLKSENTKQQNLKTFKAIKIATRFQFHSLSWIIQSEKIVTIVKIILFHITKTVNHPINTTFSKKIC